MTDLWALLEVLSITLGFFIYMISMAGITTCLGKAIARREVLTEEDLSCFIISLAMLGTLLAVVYFLRNCN